ncbi:MAG TPA: serine/threonine-protein kinase [Kofleriaceae bacterium]|nr:serine/threonine-protein kinase [Kofleriaceae bacterium]
MSGTDNSRGENGTVFGPYRVFERIGVGGMATVHRAKEIGIEGFERWVALKRLLPHLAEDASFVRAFVREAKLASMLAHPNVVQIYELGRVGQVYFISMELIEGYDIRQILRQARKIAGPPPIPVVIALLAQICEALDYAHARGDEDGTPLGLVHRDVSPSNVIVGHSGHIKVIDFGIAKAQTQQLQTQTGKVKGKMAYMSPEAIRGATIDHRSDLFSLGVLAHELLTARPLFATKNDYKTLQRVQTATVAPPSTYNRDCPPELDAIVLRALDRDPDERWQSAGEIRDELNALRKQPPMNAQHRDIVDWMRWAFTRAAPIAGTSGPYRVGVIDTPRAGSHPSVVLGDALSVDTPVTGPPRVPVADVALPMAEEDDEILEIAWGGRSDHGVVLHEVPDVSSRSGPAIAASASSSGHTPRPTNRAGVTPTGAAELSASQHGPGSSATLVSRVPPPPERASARSPRSWATGTRPPGALEAGDGDELRFERPPPGRYVDPEPDTIPITAPVVRFRSTGEQSAIAAPASMRTPTPIPIWPPTPIRTPTPTPRGPRAATSIGTSIVERGQRRARATMVVAVLLLAGGAAAFYLTSRNRTTKAPVAALIPTSTLRLVIEPPDATVSVGRVDGAAPQTFTGSPIATELHAGSYLVTVEHEGFKPWRAPIEITADANQSLHVVLAPDDSELPSELVARPTELAASTTSRDARRRRANAPTLERPDQPLASAGDDAPIRLDPRIDNALPLAGTEPPRAPRARPAEIVVPPTAVRKIRGAVPRLATRGDELPARISAQLCMNTDGRVDRVEILTAVPDHAIKPLERALLTWRYRPYTDQGRPARACFAVTFRAN